jgi:hypothetical protein
MSKYLPSLPKLSQETLATLAAIIISAVIVANVPALKRLVKDYES